MTLEDPVTMGDRYARAANTSRLTMNWEAYKERTDADTLLAAGIAASGNREKSVALSLYRVGVTGDRSGLPAIVGELVDWLAVGQRRIIPLAARRALVMSVVVWWFEQRCRYCSGADGKGFVVMPNAPTLSAEACSACHGTGRRPLAREVPHAHRNAAQWLAAKLDQLVAGIHADMARLLKDRLDL